MIQKRRALVAALIASGSAIPAGAGCFDWLFHKHQPPAAPVLPYAAGLAPTTVTSLGPPVAVGAPTSTLPVGSAADLAPVVQPSLSNTYAANYGGLQPATAAQMPAYALPPAPINNPSVLTGLPVTAGSVPAGNTVAAYYGAVPAPPVSYNAAAAYQMQLPATATSQAAYYAPPAPAYKGCGLLGHIFGNRYQTNYNNVPTTVYRPVQQLNPTTGQTVIVQQPCTTITQQVQRTPYTSLQPAQPAIVAPPPAPYYGEPTCGNESPRYLPPAAAAPQPVQPQYAPQQPYAPQPQYAPQQSYAPQSQYAPQGNMQAGGVAPIGSGLSQATAIAPAQNGVSPYGAPPPTSAPLQGNPGVVTQPSDAVPVDQPRLESARPSLTPPATSTPPPAEAPAENAAPPAAPTWPGNNSAAYRSSEPARASGDNDVRAEPAPPPAQASSGTVPYSDLPPIPAADEYRPPAWSPHSGNANPPSNGQPWQPREQSQPSQPQTPPLSPPSLQDRTAAYPAPANAYPGGFQRSEPAARYASALQEPSRQPARPIAEPPRDDSGWFAIQP